MLKPRVGFNFVKAKYLRVFKTYRCERFFETAYLLPVSDYLALLNLVYNKVASYFSRFLNTTNFDRRATS